MRTPRFQMIQVFLLLVFGSCCGNSVFSATSSQRGKTTLDATGVQGGLVVHVGCGAGELTAEMCVNESYIIEGLDTDGRSIESARRHAQSLKRLGRLSFATFDGQRLPYPDNLVNLLVISNEFDVAKKEMQRVLAPGGVMTSVAASSFLSAPFKKPWPDEIDEWTHFLHSASGNAVGQDRVVAAPHHLQWADGPLWSRSHEYDSSLCAMVSAQGRMFSIFDHGPTGIIDPRIPDQWTLIARDAFSGVVLWRRPISDWGWKAWRPQMAQADWRSMPSYRCALPLSVPRRLVAQGDRVYTTLGYKAPAVALDAATGQPRVTYAGTEHTDEILFYNGQLILCVRPPAETPAKDEKAKRPSKRGRVGPAVLMAFQPNTGKKLWQLEPMPVAALSLCANGDSVFCHAQGAVVCFDLTTGQQRWRTPAGGPGVPMVVHDHVVMCLSGKQLVGLSAKDGQQMWQSPAPRGFSVVNPPDLFVADGLVWFGQTNPDANSITGHDPMTGKPVRTIEYGPLVTRGHHARCYRSKATENFFFLPKRGVELVDIHGDQHSRHNWVRGACRYGVLPCNGLLYSSPHPCFCYAGVKLGGFMALAPERKPSAERKRRTRHSRLERGPAFGSASIPNSTLRIPHASSWPAYRHDALRSGSVRTVVSVPARPEWTASVGGKLTQPIIADGRVFVACVNEGTVCCLNAETGEPLWDFIAGGRVDSSPTFYQGRLIFGSADGHVYCLRASDGELAWRFRAAPEDRRVVSFGQVESVWPVHGSVLVFRDVAYFTAGRSSFLDGGVYLYGLDPLTGELRHKTRMDGPRPDATTLDEAAYAMEGTKSDILVTDGELIYLYHNAFDAQMRKQPIPVLGELGVRNLGERKFNQHLFSNAGFLDDSWFSRSHWMLGDHWTAFNFAHQAPKEGQLLVFDETHAYAVKCFARRNRLSPLFFPATDGYFLVADRKTTAPVIVNPRQQPKYQTWLPQEGKLQKCWNLDVGFARGTPPEWTSNIKVRIRAMVQTSNALFVAGPPDVCDPKDPMAALEGRRGGVLIAFDPKDGSQLDEYRFDSPPVFDGMAAANGRLYQATLDGQLICLSNDAKTRRTQTSGKADR
jgi:outer membrane protein assembly factor BamB/ubiquinone/menaquinone biosynthesis C-methylase UbiE